MWQIERHGRVIMGRIVAFADDADAERYCDEWRRRAGEIVGRIIVCADYRRVPVFSPGAAEALKHLMEGLNARIERSAMLVDAAHATHSMQVSRLAREAAHQARRRFDDAATMEAWLDEVASDEERQAVRAFLACSAG